MSIHEVYVDGASRGNPGRASAAYVILGYDGQLRASGAEAIGQATNNEAEYQAVIMGLKRALRLGIEAVRVHSDSELVVRQVNGEYQVRSEDLEPLYLRVRELRRKFKWFRIVHVRREFNRMADALANEALAPRRAVPLLQPRRGTDSRELALTTDDLPGCGPLDELLLQRVLLQSLAGTAMPGSSGANPGH